MKKLYFTIITLMVSFAALAQSGAHSIEYTKNSSGIHVLMTKGIISVENTDDDYVLGNLSMIYTDDSNAPYPIISLIFEEMDLKGRVGELLKLQSGQISITLSNGEVFSCPPSATMIKRGYALLGDAVSLNFSVINMTSKNSPSGSLEKARYAMKQLCTYNIRKVTAGSCTFEVKGTSEYKLNSAPTFMEMCKTLRPLITNKQCLNF